MRDCTFDLSSGFSTVALLSYHTQAFAMTPSALAGTGPGAASSGGLNCREQPHRMTAIGQDLVRADRVPNRDPVVLSAHTSSCLRQPRPIRRPADQALQRTQSERRKRPPGGRSPDMHGAIVPMRNQALPIGQPANGLNHPSGMGSIDQKLLTSGGLPEMDLSIVACRGNLLPIWRPGHRIDIIRVTAIGETAFPRSGLPHLYIPMPCGSDPGSIWRPGQRIDMKAMSLAEKNTCHARHPVKRL